MTVKHQLQHLGDVFRKYKVSTLGEINSNNRGVLIEVSEAISKIKGTCRNIQRPGGDVFGEFFLLLLCYFPLSSRRNEKSQK